MSDLGHTTSAWLPNSIIFSDAQKVFPKPVNPCQDKMLLYSYLLQTLRLAVDV